MPVVIVLAVAVILAGVVVVAMGRGGELDRERAEMPTRSDFRTWSDVAGYRPPAALLGYQVQATKHALSLIARTIAERDAEIDWLRERLAEAARARPAPAPDAAGGDDLAGLSPGAGAGPDAGAGLETGYREAPGTSAPGFQPAPPADSAEDGNGHVRPGLSPSVSLSGELRPVPQRGVPQIHGWQARGEADPAADPAAGAAGARGQQSPGAQPGGSE